MHTTNTDNKIDFPKEDMPVWAGATYGIAHQIEPEDPRQKEWAKQRVERGFDNTELWNLDATFARFMLPRLKAFMEVDPFKRTAEWPERMATLIEGFELMATECGSLDPEDHKKANTAMDIFREEIFSLWY